MKDTNTQTQRVEVSLLGGFNIKIGDTVITDSSSRTTQIWNLLEYLITFRNKTIAQEELIEALWEEGDIDNPVNALKNLVYRVRSYFASQDISFAKSIITYSHGSYQWNSDLDCVVDTEEFENAYKLASNDTQPVEYRIEKYKQALDIFKGDFLPASAHKSWAMPVNSYYKSMYFNCVYEVLELLTAQERHNEIEMICKKALMIDKFEENIHKHLMYALIHQNQQSQAIAHYKFISDLFTRELGVSPSSSLRNLYRQIAKPSYSSDIDVGIIIEDLDDVADGAFYCEYEVFKSIYQVEARLSMRHGPQIYVGLVSIVNDKGGTLDTASQSRTMDRLFRTIQTNLRAGDVFSKFSESQYVLILPTTSIEFCSMVLQRIVDRYFDVYADDSDTVQIKTSALEPGNTRSLTPIAN